MACSWFYYNTSKSFVLQRKYSSRDSMTCHAFNHPYINILNLLSNTTIESFSWCTSITYILIRQDPRTFPFLEFFFSHNQYMHLNPWVRWRLPFPFKTSIGDDIFFLHFILKFLNHKPYLRFLWNFLNNLRTSKAFSIKHYHIYVFHKNNWFKGMFVWFPMIFFLFISCLVKWSNENWRKMIKSWNHFPELERFKGPKLD